MDFKSLNTFIQVAELNSFTKAGEKLGYSQPTVSLQIKQLEQELGFTPVSRSRVQTVGKKEESTNGFLDL